jgi:hypothetical protein
MVTLYKRNSEHELDMNVKMPEPALIGSPFIRAAQLPPSSPPSTFSNSVVILTLFWLSLRT